MTYANGSEPKRVHGHVFWEMLDPRLVGPDAPAPDTPEWNRLVEKMCQRAESERRARGLPPVQVTEPDCAICDDFGFVEAPNGTGFYACRCTIERERQARLRKMGLGAADCDYTLNNYSPAAHSGAADALAAVQRYVDQWPDHCATGRGLYIWGDVGVGKTHLAVGTMIELDKLYGVDGLYAPVADLLDAASDYTNGSPREVMEVARTTGLLVLDDISIARRTDYRREQIYRIIDRRIADRLATIVTANCPASSLESLYGKPVVSRLRGSCAEVHVRGEDMRSVVRRED